MTAPVAIAEELLTESQAVARIPGRDAEVREWLRGLGIARREGFRVSGGCQAEEYLHPDIAHRISRC